tara:strand:+ start:133 stop:339 length:207 start_codon:yes stop_codon:yes gene_type:complete
MFDDKTNSTSFTTNFVMRLVVLLEQKGLVNRSEVMALLMDATNDTAKEQNKEDKETRKELLKEFPRAH